MTVRRNFFTHPLPSAQARRIQQHPPSPAIDIEVAYQLTHAAHALALLRLGHGQRSVERLRALLDVVRINDECLVQLARSAGELGQYQDAQLVIARSNEFFGDQIHAVMQAGDDADIAAAITARQPLGVEVLHAQQYGGCDQIDMALVDLQRKLAHASLKVLVLIQ